jgi:lactoylglutathione lyase
MKLAYVILYVQDVIKTVEFYKLAFGLEQGFLCESKLYASMKTGDTELAFVFEGLLERYQIEIQKNRHSSLPAGSEIALTTEDVDSAFKRAVVAGAVALMDPSDKPWGQRTAIVRDLNGFMVELCSTLKQD